MGLENLNANVFPGVLTSALLSQTLSLQKALHCLWYKLL